METTNDQKIERTLPADIEEQKGRKERKKGNKEKKAGRSPLTSAWTPHPSSRDRADICTVVFRPIFTVPLYRETKGGGSFT
jgi:hypothetical protein